MRLALAMTQADLARKAGISRITVSRLELGKPASCYSVRKIADALDVEICDFAKVVAVA